MIEKPVHFLGADCYYAQIVYDLRKKNPTLKLHCILPCEGQAGKWSDSSRERYRPILKQADTVDYVSRAYYNGYMIDRNHRLVKSADLLLAVYNGARRSGSGATVNCARKFGREIIVIDPLPSTSPTKAQFRLGAMRGTGYEKTCIYLAPASSVGFGWMRNEAKCGFKQYCCFRRTRLFL